MQTRTIACDNRSFTAHELSLQELRDWYASLLLPGGPCDIVDELALPDISLTDLARICHCDATEFDSLVYRELEAIADAARIVNPHFFRLRGLIAETTRAISEAVTVGYPPATVEAE